MAGRWPHGADLQLDVHTRFLVDLKHDSGGGLSFEAGGFRGDAVDANRQQRHGEDPALAGDGLSGESGVFRDHGDADVVGTIAPLGSVTAPTMVPVVWLHAAMAKDRMTVANL